MSNKTPQRLDAQRLTTPELSNKSDAMHPEKPQRLDIQQVTTVRSSHPISNSPKFNIIYCHNCLKISTLTPV